LTTGYHDLPVEPASLPANFNYEPYVPGITMAKSSDLMIHHGGHGASLTGPYTGTPALVIPTFSERESNARRVAGLGAAELVVPTEDAEWEKHVSAEAVRTKARQAMSNPSYAENARLVGEKMHRYGGASQAARLITDLAPRG
jgi:UDP:flavonoid glycosyltransferase YjiC (YdhE family)